MAKISPSRLDVSIVWLRASSMSPSRTPHGFGHDCFANMCVPFCNGLKRSISSQPLFDPENLRFSYGYSKGETNFDVFLSTLLNPPSVPFDHCGEGVIRLREHRRHKHGSGPLYQLACDSSCIPRGSCQIVRLRDTFWLI